MKWKSAEVFCSSSEAKQKSKKKKKTTNTHTHTKSDFSYILIAFVKIINIHCTYINIYVKKEKGQICQIYGAVLLHFNFALTT